MSCIINPPARIVSSDVIEITSDKITPNIGGTIVLEASKSYIFTGEVDLKGNRLICPNGNVDILGYSSETSRVTSTGLPSGSPLITATNTVAMRNITFEDIDTALDFDGLGNTMALDWTGVNFQNIENVGTIKDCDNFIFKVGGLINSNNLIIDGTIGTVGINDSIFSGNGNAGDLIKVLSTANITRRLRITKSAVVCTGSTNGFNVDVNASIPIDSYILTTLNFSGSNPLVGVDQDDNRSNFTGCKGIINTTTAANHYMTGNSIVTTVPGLNTPTKVLGITINNTDVTRRFSHTNNRDTYTGAIKKLFKIDKTVSLSSGNNNQITFYLYKNGVKLDATETRTTSDGNGRSDDVFIQGVIELEQNDDIELYVEKTSGNNNVTVRNINSIILET